MEKFRFCSRLLCFFFFVTCVGCSRNDVNNDINNNYQRSTITDVNTDISYLSQIKPILDGKCVSCHSCYDGPCQLKLESASGLLRGASKDAVYNATRLKTAHSTRLGIDAQNVSEWRKLNFFSVLPEEVSNNQVIDVENNQEKSKKEKSPYSVVDEKISVKKIPDKNESDVNEKSIATEQSIFSKLIVHGKENGFPANSKITKNEIILGTKRELTCPTKENIDDYMDDNPRGGMPLAVSGLTDKEYKLINNWLSAGAKIDIDSRKVSSSHEELIDNWESWLNQTDSKQQLISRYIYEHLFLGHLYLDTTDKLNKLLSDSYSNNKDTDRNFVFYQLLRSKTPPGEAIEPIATNLPNDDPKGVVFYRLRPVEESIVYKNHITYRFDATRYNSLKKLFSSIAWHIDKLPGYAYEERANPFITFSAIPSSIRYRFLLNDAEYFVRNFIRGPVCHGPIATDVIRDNFWVMFENPKTELFTNNLSFREKAEPLLGLPGEKDGLFDFGPEWLKYSDQRDRYQVTRDEFYANEFSDGADLDQVWVGEGGDEGKNPNAFLTVFRHHDNASVTRGWRGEVPLTAWMIDYPLFERSYYELVAGFNVYGSLSHQVQTRLYFDLIRNGGETNFLRLMPITHRKTYYDEWYKGSAKLKVLTSYTKIDTKTPSNITWLTDKPKYEFFDLLFNDHPKLTKYIDTINRCDNECQKKSEIHKQKNENIDVDPNLAAQMRQISSINQSNLSVIKYLPEITYLSVYDSESEGDDNVKQRFESASNKASVEVSSSGSLKYVFSIVRNRMHSNVAFMMGESLRYEEEKDSLTVLPEVLGSYPNLMLSTSLKHIPEMINSMKNIKSDKDFELFIDTYGVRRMQNNFWKTLHDIQHYNEEKNAIDSGIIDINRYGYW